MPQRTVALPRLTYAEPRPRPLMSDELRREILREIYEMKQVDFDPPYGRVHQFVCEKQPEWEERLGYRFGYTFKDVALTGKGVFDPLLQRDIDILTAAGHFKNRTDTKPNLRLQTHSTHSTKSGRRELEVRDFLRGENYLLHRSRAQLRDALRVE